MSMRLFRGAADSSGGELYPIQPQQTIHFEVSVQQCLILIFFNLKDFIFYKHIFKM